MQGWRDEPFPVAFVLIALKAERMTTSFHSVAGVDGSRTDDSAQTTLNALLLNPRPDVFFIELTHDVSGVEPFHGLLEAFQDHIGTHAPHLAADQSMVAHHHGALFEVLGLVVRDQHPRRFFSREEPCDGQFGNIVLLPIEGAHCEQVSRAVSQREERCFHVRHLLEEQVSVFPVGLDGSLDLEANAVVSGRRGENHETLTVFHRFTSARVAPRMPRALTTG